MIKNNRRRSMFENKTRQKMKKMLNPATGDQKTPGTHFGKTVSGNYPRISVLINSAYYFIQCVFIHESGNSYRLLALHREKVIIDKSYPTLRGARIAFTKFCRDTAWRDDIKPAWTPFYTPETWWLENKFHLLPSPGSEPGTHV